MTRTRLLLGILLLSAAAAACDAGEITQPVAAPDRPLLDEGGGYAGSGGRAPGDSTGNGGGGGG